MINILRFFLKDSTTKENIINNIEDSSYNRKNLLEKISKGSEWSDANDTSNYEAIKGNLHYLKDNLDLDGLKFEIYRKENKDYNNLSGYLTSRQVRCMEAIVDDVNERNVQGAYHELYDFIQSYNELNDKHIDIIEKIVIQIAITQINDIFALKEDHDSLFERYKKSLANEYDLEEKLKKTKRELYEYKVKEMTVEEMKKVSNFDISEGESPGTWEMYKGICQLGGCYMNAEKFSSYEDALKEAAILSLMGEEMDCSGVCPECYAEYMKECE